MPRVRIGELELFHTADGAGEPVLLVMGLGGEHHAWDLVRRELARRYRLVLLDNRDAGASSSSGPPPPSAGGTPASRPTRSRSCRSFEPRASSSSARTTS